MNKALRPSLLGIFALGLIVSGNSTAVQQSLTEYKYDSRGRLRAVTNNLSQEIYYEYDDAGNRTKVTNTAPQPTPDPAITYFIAPSSVNRAGDYATVSWGSTDATHCAIAIFGDYSQNPNLPTTGSRPIQINRDTAVTVTCYRDELSASAGKTIRVLSSGGGGHEFE